MKKRGGSCNWDADLFDSRSPRAPQKRLLRKRTTLRIAFGCEKVERRQFHFLFFSICRADQGSQIQRRPRHASCPPPTIEDLELPPKSSALQLRLAFQAGLEWVLAQALPMISRTLPAKEMESVPRIAFGNGKI